MCSDSSEPFTCNNNVILIASLRGRYCYNFRFIGSDVDTSGTAEGHIIACWSLPFPGCWLLRVPATHVPTPSYPITHSWAWLCLPPAGHARLSCHLPEVWSILASSSFWTSPSASVCLSAWAARLHFQILLIFKAQLKCWAFLPKAFSEPLPLNTLKLSKYHTRPWYLNYLDNSALSTDKHDIWISLIFVLKGQV